MKRKPTHTRQSNPIPLLITLLVLFLILCLILVLRLRAPSRSADTADGTRSAAAERAETEEQPESPSPENSIAIPGYEGLTLIANSAAQTLCLPNPETNDCYFILSLYLADGTLLWESDLIEPGESSEPIVLTQALEAGSYPKARLVYSCFTYDRHKTPLNGADMKLTLHVK